jgi:hypothetical protein
VAEQTARQKAQRNKPRTVASSRFTSWKRSIGLVPLGTEVKAIPKAVNLRDKASPA